MSYDYIAACALSRGRLLYGRVCDAGDRAGQHRTWSSRVSATTDLATSCPMPFPTAMALRRDCCSLVVASRRGLATRIRRYTTPISSTARSMGAATTRASSIAGVAPSPISRATASAITGAPPYPARRAQSARIPLRRKAAGFHGCPEHADSARSIRRGAATWSIVRPLPTALRTNSTAWSTTPADRSAGARVLRQEHGQAPERTAAPI